MLMILSLMADRLSNGLWDLAERIDANRGG